MLRLQISVLDKALEWLIPKIKNEPDITILNYDSGEDIDALQALCVWCLRLRYNLVEHGHDGIQASLYGSWRSDSRQASLNLYSFVEKIAKLYVAEGGKTPDYSKRNHVDVSRWTYKRIFGPDNFTPVHFSVNELWEATLVMFPSAAGNAKEERKNMEAKELELEMNVSNLLALLEEI